MRRAKLKLSLALIAFGEWLINKTTKYAPHPNDVEEDRNTLLHFRRLKNSIVAEMGEA